jgi:hypothetical protein
MENKGGGVGGKHTHRTPISIDNPEVRKEHDWWAELCEAHGAKNYWQKNNWRKNKNRKGKEEKKPDERESNEKESNEKEVSGG